ncbi:hypothetical protein HF086_000609 [Spodoptera exigua]|uniref:Angiotensin-converting enzyme n=1 Tax=Spodoptera exigua TaxID=7107 RepID=A0A922SDM8_SPOEX|nr:hypothetical protein HF086_000609 [Spodoptera exigua]
MSPTLTLFCIFFYALLSPLQCGTSSSADDDRRWLVSLVDLVELDYVDHCEQRANAAWNELTGNSKGLASKLERDKTFGMFVCQQTTDIKSALTAHALSADDHVLRRKVKLLLQPGDTLLDTEQWIRLVTFGDNAQHKIRFATNYDCGTATNCTLKELHYYMARQQDEETLHRMKQSWERNLPDINDYLEHILPLLRNASKKNRSLTGDDWSNLIESLLPKHAGIYQKVHANLQLKNLGGVEAFKQAAKLIKALNLGDADPDIWTESVFNSTCPPTLVDWCKPNKVRAITCKDVSIANYIEAHEAVMKIVYKQTINLHSNNTYILREASRYSAVYEAIPGFVSLLSVNPHALSKAGLFPVETFNYNANHHRLVLQLIMALRDLPKLNFYLAADEWRIKVLMGAIPYAKIPSSWSDFRKNFSNIETADSDFLGDPYMMFNKPFIGKFMGLILKYQIYQSFAEELISDDSDLIKHVAENNERLIDAMMQGYGTVWPEMVSDLLAKREYGLEYTGLTDYYKFLDEYLDNQLEPSTDTSTSDDYVEPVEPEPVPEENEIPSSAENQENKNVDKVETHEDIVDNVIDTGDESNSKFGVETSTVGVLEIKNPVAPGDQKEENTKEASYSTYWWIGIAVALAVVVILIAIIARKRHSHRKQLERQRKNNSHA